MEQTKKYWPLILIFICFAAFYFYWFELRPSKIRISCGQQIQREIDEGKSYSVDQVKNRYYFCLIKNGLKQNF
jgi:hypothetical protein